MSSRLAFESWQLLFPAIGLGIFAAIFVGVVFRVWRMKPPAVGHLENLPLVEESVSRPANAPSPRNPTSPTTKASPEHQPPAEAPGSRARAVPDSVSTNG